LGGSRVSIRGSGIGGGKGVSNQVNQGLQADANQLTSIAGQQNANSQSLFSSAFPGFQTAENFYGALASGDPTAIARATAPANQQINQAQTGARTNILDNSPAGGERNLALEQSRVSQGAQVGQTASQGYLNSFNALGQLAGQGVGESTAAAGTGISGYSAANQGLGQLGNLQIQQKGASLGALGGLGGDAASLLGSASPASSSGKAGASGLGLLFGA
jgi:hypothetical protein